MSAARELLAAITRLASELIAVPSLSGRQGECQAALDVVSRRLAVLVREGRVREQRLWWSPPGLERERPGEAPAGRDDGAGDPRHGAQPEPGSAAAGACHSRLWSTGGDGWRPSWLLAGHVDVVDARPEWRPFEPRVAAGRLYGRGAGDMKGSVAVMVEVYRRWAAAGSAGGVALLLTSDEEIGGDLGAGAAATAGLRPEWAFIPDGGEDFSIVRSQKAPYHFRVTATGPGGHASRAFEVPNPLNRLWRLYGALRDRYALADCEHSWASTLEMTQVESRGSSANTIPTECGAWFSWRFPPEQHDFARESARIRELCAEHSCAVTAEHGGGKGCSTDPSEPEVGRWKATIEGILGRPVEFAVAHGASDARHLAAVGTKVLMTNPRVGNLHANDEWVELESLGQLAQGLESFLGGIGPADAAAVPAVDG